MPKYILMGVGGNLGNIAASYALEIAPSDSTLVFSTSDPDKIPSETRRVWSEKGATLSVASYDDVSSLQRVFVGAEAVTLISKWHWVAAMNTSTKCHRRCQILWCASNLLHFLRGCR